MRSLENFSVRAKKAQPRAGSKKMSLGERAAMHPEAAKWEARLTEIDSENPEDALSTEHRAELAEDIVAQLMRNEAMKYFLPRIVAASPIPEGEHLQRAMALVDELKQTYGVGVDAREAAAFMDEGRMEAEKWFADEHKKRKEGLNTFLQQTLIDRRLRELERANDSLRQRLEQAA